MECRMSQKNLTMLQMYETISLKKKGERKSVESDFGNEWSLLLKAERQNELYRNTRLHLIKLFFMRLQVNNSETTRYVYYN